MVNDNIVPMGQARCNFILNVAPNRDGQIDDNALEALKEIGRLWKQRGHVADIDDGGMPVIASNIAKNRPASYSWSNDMNIGDFAFDDNYSTQWIAHPSIPKPWISVRLDSEKPFNMVVLTQRRAGGLRSYKIEYRISGEWKTAVDVPVAETSRVQVLRFDTVYGDMVRLSVEAFDRSVAIAEFGVYKERR